ncbi:MAG: sigma-70 family RNA polymerase sigma factor [Phycisphaerales bacterium]|nr:sigma-70 family RNA polymerase sigma factor [Phycisphaerales bacterium]
MEPEFDSREVARLLEAVATNNEGSAELVTTVYAELRALAATYLSGQSARHTLQPTALVHEAFVRLVGNAQLSVESRVHFFAIAARAMRNVMVDHLRRKRSEKRGGDWERVTLAGIPAAGAGTEFDAADVHAALVALAELNERQAQIVELRFFGGLSIEQIAIVLGVGKRTVDADWQFARAWLRGRLERSA